MQKKASHPRSNLFEPGNMSENITRKHLSCPVQSITKENKNMQKIISARRLYHVVCTVLWLNARSLPRHEVVHIVGKVIILKSEAATPMHWRSERCTCAWETYMRMSITKSYTEQHKASENRKKQIKKHASTLQALDLNHCERSGWK